MKHLMTAVALSLAALTGSALATTHKEAPDMGKKPMSSQQEKMTSCQKSATDSGKKGSERQAMVNDCLKTKPMAEKTMTPQQEKMGTCQKTATDSGKKGAERQAVLSECLKKTPA